MYACLTSTSPSLLLVVKLEIVRLNTLQLPLPRIGIQNNPQCGLPVRGNERSFALPCPENLQAGTISASQSPERPHFSSRPSLLAGQLCPVPGSSLWREAKMKRMRMNGGSGRLVRDFAGLLPNECRSALWNLNCFLISGSAMSLA